MQVEAALDIKFLVDLLADLANLNVREFSGNTRLLRDCLVRLLQRVFRWYVERPDNWRDAVSLAYGPFLCDCEDIAALVAAILSMLYPDVFVGIKLVSPSQCHAIVRLGNMVVDFCPLFGMKKGDGTPKPTEWVKLPDNRNLFVETSEGKRKVIDVGIELVAELLRKKPQEVREELDNAVKEASEPDNTLSNTGDDSEVSDTGASIADSLAGYLIPGSLVSKVTALESQVKQLKSQRDTANKQKADVEKALKSEKLAHEDTKKKRDQYVASIRSDNATLVANLKKEIDGAKRRLAEFAASSNQRAASADQQVKQATNQTLELEKALAAANALATAQKSQIDELLRRSNDSNRERIQDLKSQLNAPDYVQNLAQSFVDEPFGAYDAFYAIEAAGYVLSGEHDEHVDTGAHEHKKACCDDCEKGLPCSGGTCGHSHDKQDVGAEFVSGGDTEFVSDLSELDTGSVSIPTTYNTKVCKTGCPL